jgi:hypothetical protein
MKRMFAQQQLPLPTGLRTTAVRANSMDINEYIVDSADDHVPGGCFISFLWIVHALWLICACTLKRRCTIDG